MKHLFFTTVLLAALAFAGSISTPALAAKNTALSPKSKTVEVYYFHRNRRCGPCTTIENLTKKTMETHFTSEMQKGEVIFQIVNVQTTENREIAQKFNAMSTALFLNTSDEAGDHPKNLTGFAYRFVRDEQAFLNGLKEEVDKALGR